LPSEEGSSHDLLAGSAFPDLSSQLDLWSTLTFDNEDSAISPREENAETKQEDDDEEEEPAAHDSHVNVVTGTVIPNQGVNHPYQQPPVPQQDFDLTTFLSGFGINPFTQAPSVSPQQPQPAVPSLAQLLALHASQRPTIPFNIPIPSLPATTASAQSSVVNTPGPTPPPAKKSRTRKASVSVSPDSPEDPKNAVEIALSAAEDKRKRNTAASARFRLKKKEREAALESRAKELEAKVSELERECEGLRRENGWLKGLVVGVTGAQQHQQQQLATGQKRGREDEA
jgi:hypothetical protein